MQNQKSKSDKTIMKPSSNIRTAFVGSHNTGKDSLLIRYKKQVFVVCIIIRLFLILQQHPFLYNMNIHLFFFFFYFFFIFNIKRIKMLRYLMDLNNNLLVEQNQENQKIGNEVHLMSKLCLNLHQKLQNQN